MSDRLNNQEATAGLLLDSWRSFFLLLYVFFFFSVVFKIPLTVREPRFFFFFGEHKKSFETLLFRLPANLPYLSQALQSQR